MKCQRRTDTACGNPLMTSWEQQHRQKMHRDKVRSISSNIDTRAPTSQPHLTLYGRDYVAKKRSTVEAAFSDLKMIQHMAKTMTRKSEVPERKGPVSLNADVRRREINRISKENLRLLDRLDTNPAKASSPSIVTKDLLREHAWRQRYTVNSSHTMRRCGEYDDVIRHFHSENKTKEEEVKRVITKRERDIEDRRERMQMSSQSMPNMAGGSDSPGRAAQSPAGGLGLSAATAGPLPPPTLGEELAGPQPAGGAPWWRGAGSLARAAGPPAQVDVDDTANETPTSERPRPTDLLSP